MKENKYIYLMVFLYNFAVMLIEIAAARLLAPYVGTSYIIWVIIIGIVMTALSIGNIIGGKIADKNKDFKLSRLLIILTLFIFFITNSKIFLEVIAFLNISIAIKALIISIVMFAFPNVIFGILSPYIFNMKIKNNETKGQDLGKLNAIGTLGSLFGTFLTGFLILPLFGTINAFFVAQIAVFIMLVITFKREEQKYTKMICAILTFIIIAVVTHNIKPLYKDNKLVYDTDSLYNRIIVQDIENKSGKIFRTVRTDNLGIQTMLDLNAADKLQAKYLQLYDLYNVYNKDAKEFLMLGGGAYSYPVYFTNKYNKNIDVVEIDKKFTEIAKKYFQLKDESKITTYNKDAREYIRYTDKKYDVIFNDCFLSINVPIHLTTIEFNKSIKDRLNEDGIYMTNIVSKPNSFMFKSMIKTIKSVFNYVTVYKVNLEKTDSQIQNIIVVGHNSNKKEDDYLEKNIINVDSKEAKIITDDKNFIDILGSLMLI